MSLVKLFFRLIYAVLLSPFLARAASKDRVLHRKLIRPLLQGPFEGDLLDDIWQLVYRLEDGELDNEAFITQVAEVMKAAVSNGQLDAWLTKPIADDENVDITLKRALFYVPFKRWYLKLHFMAPGNIHKPHGHRDVLSTQVIARGQMAVQEFDLVGDLHTNPTTLRVCRDEVVGPLASITTTDKLRNVHGFQPHNGSVVRFQFYLRGQAGIMAALFPKRGRLYVEPLWETRNADTVQANLGRAGRPGES